MPIPTTSSSLVEEVVSFEQARHLVEVEAHALLITNTGKIKTELAPLLRSHGRVPAQEVRADRDLPPFRRAARDGYALLAADIQSATEQTPIELKVVGEIAAGADELPELRRGEAVEIMTGAPAP